MNLKHKIKYEAALLAICVGMAASSGVAFAKEKFVPLNDAQFEQAKSMYSSVARIVTAFGVKVQPVQIWNRMLTKSLRSKVPLS